jgi:methyl-accepting chemotaxis protein
VKGVQSVTTIVAEIGASARGQTAGLEQVAEALAKADAVTHRNADTAARSSTIASELADQAGALESTVASFRLDDAPGVRAAPAHALPPRQPPTARA